MCCLVIDGVVVAGTIVGDGGGDGVVAAAVGDVETPG